MPETMSSGKRSPYEVLGLPFGASEVEVKAAYRKLAKELHPDKAVEIKVRAADMFASPLERNLAQRELSSRTEHFQEIQNAYDTLMDPIQREFLANITEKRPDLHEAAAAGNLDLVEKIVEGGTDINERDKTERTALMLASSNARVTIVDWLIDHHADLELSNCAGHTAVMFAVGSANPTTDDNDAHLQTLRTLIRHSANVNAQTCYGLTALMLACGRNLEKQVDLLIDAKASVNNESDIGLTALGFAVDKGHLAVTNRLLQAPYIELETRYGPKGRTPLIAACCSGHVDCVAALLAAGADPHRPDKEGKFPEDYALDFSQVDGLICPVDEYNKKQDVADEIVTLLQNAQPRNARTTLHYEASNKEHPRYSPSSRASQTESDIIRMDDFHPGPESKKEILKKCFWTISLILTNDFSIFVSDLIGCGMPGQRQRVHRSAVRVVVLISYARRYGVETFYCGINFILSNCDKLMKD